MDWETFKTMWELSAPGGPAEGCFLRLTQAEYYPYEKPKPDALEFMPDVSGTPYDIP
jgi:D-amino-acid oxidase